MHRNNASNSPKSKIYQQINDGIKNKNPTSGTRGNCARCVCLCATGATGWKWTQIKMADKGGILHTLLSRTALNLYI